MSDAPEPKKPKLSRNKKKNQRKIDTSQLEEAHFQNEKEIQLHGKPLAEKSDSELFSVDVKPMSSDQVVDELKKSDTLSAKEIRKQKYKNKSSMIDKILKPDSSKYIKPVYNERNKPKKAVEVDEKNLMKPKGGQLFKRSTGDQRFKGAAPKNYKTASKTGTYDLWGDDGEDIEKKNDTFEINLKSNNYNKKSHPFLTGGSGSYRGYNNTKKYQKHNSTKMISNKFGSDVSNKQKMLEQVEKDLKKIEAEHNVFSNKLENASEKIKNKQENRKLSDKLKLLKEQAIDTKNHLADAKNNIKSDILPHPGQSYIPDKVQHQMLLKAEYNKIIDQNEKMAKVDRDISWDVENQATDESNYKENVEGLFSEDEDWEDEEEASDAEDLGENGADGDGEKLKESKIDDGIPKTKQAKRRVKENLEKQRQAEFRKQKNREMSEIYGWGRSSLFFHLKNSKFINNYI